VIYGLPATRVQRLVILVALSIEPAGTGAVVGHGARGTPGQSA